MNMDGNFIFHLENMLFPFPLELFLFPLVAQNYSHSHGNSHSHAHLYLTSVQHYGADCDNI